MEDSTVNYFSIFGLEESVDIDIDALDTSYFGLQAKYHPDSPDRLEQYSAILNKAYSTLKDEYKRVSYMLAKKGYDLDGKSHTFNQEFLMKMMDIGEQIESLSVDNKGDIRHLYDKILKLYKQSLEQGKLHIRRGLYDEAFVEYQKMNFYRSFLEQIRNKLDQENYVI